jgi:hypothetical protein
MVRNPMKVLSHAATGYQHYGELRGGLRVLKSVAYCEAVLARGVPILSKFAAVLLDLTRHVTFSKAEVNDFEYKSLLAKGVNWEMARRVEVTPATRLRFEKSWGIGVERQLQIERELVLPKLPTSWDPALYEEVVPDARDPYSRMF